MFYQSLQKLEFQDSESALEVASEERVEDVVHTTDHGGYSDGYNAGYQDAIAASKTNTNALKSIGEKIIVSVVRHDRAVEQLQEQLTERIGDTVYEALAGVVPSLRESCGLEIVINFLKESAPKVKSNVVVEVNPELAEELRIWLCQSDTVSYSANSRPSDQMNIVNVTENEALDLGDARILFNECGVEQILGLYEKNIKHFVKQKLYNTKSPQLDTQKPCDTADPKLCNTQNPKPSDTQNPKLSMQKLPDTTDPEVCESAKLDMLTDLKR